MVQVLNRWLLESWHTQRTAPREGNFAYGVHGTIRLIIVL